MTDHAPAGEGPQGGQLTRGKLVAALRRMMAEHAKEMDSHEFWTLSDAAFAMEAAGGPGAGADSQQVAMLKTLLAEARAERDEAQNTTRTVLFTLSEACPMLTFDPVQPFAFANAIGWRLKAAEAERDHLRADLAEARRVLGQAQADLQCWTAWQVRCAANGIHILAPTKETA